VSAADERHASLRTQSGVAPKPMLVQIFAKAPAPGAVKTRLVATLGERGAAELHRRLLRHAARTVALAQVGAAELWTTAGADPALLDGIAGLSGIPVRLQPDGDLGVRMSAAIAGGLERARAVLLLGVDVPGMLADDLSQARDALASGYDAVLGPVEDGGYWLIGVARGAPTQDGGVRRIAAQARELFRAVPWSTPDVLDVTRERLRALGWRWCELPVRWDVDRPEDVRRLYADSQLAVLAADLVPRP
jgi:rSAM/selenodomain-associated transferase 1